MAATIRYRTGVDRFTGVILRGWDHVRQSLDVIWTTRMGELVMLLDFGSDVRGLLAEDLTPPLALAIYDELVTAAHRWEPEYRIDQLQFVAMTADGALGLRHGGLYYPEGRFGNYEIALPVTSLPGRFGRAEVPL